MLSDLNGLDAPICKLLSKFDARFYCNLSDGNRWIAWWCLLPRRIGRPDSRARLAAKFKPRHNQCHSIADISTENNSTYVSLPHVSISKERVRYGRRCGSRINHQLAPSAQHGIDREYVHGNAVKSVDTSCEYVDGYPGVSKRFD